VRLSLAIILLSVPALIPSLAKAQETERLLPKVVEHAEPFYPSLCRQARISGDVSVRFTTDGQSVIAAEAETGHNLLRQAAEQNVRTWEFAPHEPGAFQVTFRYTIQSGPDSVVFLPSPGVVEILTSPPVLIVDCAWMGLGNWAARLTSTRGRSRVRIEIYAGGGCEDHSLSGYVTTPNGRKDEIDFGYYDSQQGMLGFTVVLNYPTSESVNIFFTGKISGDKLAGTFVDDKGITGLWTAVRDK
jgi:hypothetical protein